MSCSHGTSDVAPLPAPFRDDDQLRRWLGLPDTDEGRAAVQQLTSAERRHYAGMRAVELELQAGRVPRGVIACDRKRRGR